MKQISCVAIASALVAVLAGGTAAYGQSADALIDKLVDKGILTPKEATELREEVDKDFGRAYQAKTGLADWVTALRFGGDFRGRYEGFFADNPAFVDRQRGRFRVRFGATAVIKDNLEVGLRLSSSEPASGGGTGGDPISGNTTFQDNGSRKFIYIDLAYGKWTMINNSAVSSVFTVGKMQNPFVFSDMIFDADYNPEGVAEQLSFHLSDAHDLRLNLGAFYLDEVGGSARDPYMFGGQIRLESKWSPHLATSLGVAALSITHDEQLGASSAAVLTPTGTNTTVTWTVPNQNQGNRRDATSAGGRLQNNLNPIVADASVTYSLESFPMYTGPFPIQLGGDFIYNPAAPDRNRGFSGGITFGKSGKKGLWDIGYRYKYLGGDAWYEELVDSDFGAFYQSAPPGGSAGYGAGTNVRGHIFKAQYSPFDSLTLGATYFLTRLINESPAGSDSEMGRLQVDLVWKF